MNQKTVEFEVLALSNHDPEKDIIICNVYVGRMAHSLIPEYINAYKETLNPILKKHGFEVLYIPIVKHNCSTQKPVNLKVEKKKTKNVDDFLDGINKIIKDIEDKEAVIQYDKAKMAL